MPATTIMRATLLNNFFEVVEGTQFVRMKANKAIAPGAFTTLPAAESSARGILLWIEGGAGVADALYAGMKNDDDEYELVAIPLAGSASMIFTVQEGDVTASSAINTLDFDASDFAIGVVGGEANISLAYGTTAGTPLEGDHAGSLTNTHAHIDTHIGSTGSAVHGLGTMSTQNANSVTISGGAVTGITDITIADGGTGASTEAGARTNLGLGSMATQNAGAVSISGGTVAGITDITLADGGTGASLADPDADRILFWDDSAGGVTWLTAGTGLTIAGTTITASGGAGGATAVQEGGAEVIAEAAALNFDGTAFAVSDEGSDVAGITLAFGTSAGEPAEGDHDHDSDYQPLDDDLTTLATVFATASASAAASLALHEDTDNGTNKVTIIAPASVASDKTQTLQDVTGTVALTSQLVPYNAPGALTAASIELLESQAGGTDKIALAAPASVASNKVATFQDVTGTLYITGGTDVAIADGGTGQSTATAAFDALAPTTTAGDLIYHNGTDNIRLGIGTNGQVLKTNAGGTAPEWDDETAGSADWGTIGGTLADQTDLQDELDAKQDLDADLTTLATAFTTASGSGAASLQFHEDTDNGANKITLVAPASIATDKTITMPDTTGTMALTSDITLATLGVDADLATLSLPASTTISAFGATLVDDANAAAAIATLGLDADIATFALPASTTISAFGATIVDDANAAATIATLGLDADLATFALPASTTISAFGATLVDDANAAASIATLGLDADLATFALPASTTISAFGATVVDDADAATARATLGLTIGTHVQAFDADLSDIAGLTDAEGDILYRNGTQWTNLAIGNAGEALTVNAGADAPEWAVVTAGAGGNDTEFQYNNGGALGGAPELIYDDATGNIVFNEAGGDNDWRMEGDTVTDLFFLDASTDRIGIGTTTPAELFDVDGVARMTTLNIAGTNVTASAAELNFVDGVTSAIQTQIDTKAPLASPTFTGTVTLPVGLTGVIRTDTGVVSVDTDVTDIVTAASTAAAGKVELATTAETETGTDTGRAVTPEGLHDMTTLAGAAWFLDEDAMTSDSAVKTSSQQAIKAYADTKQPLDSDLTTIAGLTATTNNFMVANSSAWASRTPTQALVHLGLDADLPTFSVPASTTISAFGATIVDDADAAAVKATLGLNASTFSIPLVLGDGTNEIADATWVDFQLPVAATFTAWRVLATKFTAGSTCSIVLDVWCDTYTNFPPVDADSITASNQPTLTTAAKAEDTSITDWLEVRTAGDICRVNVDSCTSCAQVTLMLEYTRSV
jgi:hypothetical protein